MSKNLSILLIVAISSALASVLAFAPTIWSNFFKGFAVFFIFFCGMLAPAFDINVKKKDNRYGME